MKKLQITMLLVLCACLLAGCKKGNPSLKADDIKTNTLLVRNNGTVQSCFVEDFDKDYYSEDELNQFIQSAISEYAKTAGEKAVVMNSFKVNDKKAKATFTYTSIENYATFNNVEADVLSVEEAVSDERVPDTFVSAKRSDSVDKEKALSKKEYNVVIVNEPLDVIVDGTVVYYSNGLLLDDETVQSSSEGSTIIVYK